MTFKSDSTNKDAERILITLSLYPFVISMFISIIMSGKKQLPAHYFCSFLYSVYQREYTMHLDQQISHKLHKIRWFTILRVFNSKDSNQLGGILESSSILISTSYPCIWGNEGWCGWDRRNVPLRWHDPGIWGEGIYGQGKRLLGWSPRGGFRAWIFYKLDPIFCKVFQTFSYHFQ